MKAAQESVAADSPRLSPGTAIDKEKGRLRGAALKDAKASDQTPLQLLFKNASMLVSISSVFWGVQVFSVCSMLGKMRS
jgi:hypothetical protein